MLRTYRVRGDRCPDRGQGHQGAGRLSARALCPSRTLRPIMRRTYLLVNTESCWISPSVTRGALVKIRSGDVALITGASRGIGRHVALALAQRGMNLVLAARSHAGLDAVAAEVRAASGVTVWTLTVDLGDRAQATDLVARAEELAGHIDVLVNNAGLEAAVRPEEATIEELGAITDVNLLAPMVLTRKALPAMIARGRGHVVNVSSVAGLLASAYSE